MSISYLTGFSGPHPATSYPQDYLQKKCSLQDNSTITKEWGSYLRETKLFFCIS